MSTSTLSPASTDFWQKAAPDHWKNIGSPFRPATEDSDYMNYALEKKSIHNGSSLKALILGVTPEIAHLNWPGSTDLLAVDRSQEMIDSVWPGFPKQGQGALCANWLDLPLESHSRDLVLGDGCIDVLPYRDGCRDLLRSVRRVLKPQGLFVHRAFIRPDTAEKPVDVYDAIMAGEISSITAFKFRLWMSLQSDIKRGVRMGDVWDSWIKDGPNPEQMAERCGWPLEIVNSISYYRGKNFILSCPTIDELCDLMKEEGFEIVECKWPSYELGERCPTLITQIDKRK